MSDPTIEPAELTWNEQGEPRNTRFDDKYFSSEDGLEEVRYIFLANNGLPERWRERERFVIGETGFGTGLNFLATWALWRERGEPGTTLHFISVERFPLTRDDLARAHLRWPAFTELAETLRKQWPAALPGFHRLSLDSGRVILTLLFGDALEQFNQLDLPPGGGVDAWYLDGFGPRANPRMWSEPLFRQLARLSSPGATLGTFTVAGFVRRGLEGAGFRVTKVAGHGRKKQMLHGVLASNETPSPSTPWFEPPSSHQGERHAVILGAGLAGASVASALARRGWRCTVIERAERPADGASGNHAGIAMPRLSGQWDAPSRLYAEGLRYTLERLEEMGDRVPWRKTGVIQLAHDERQRGRHRKIIEGLAPPEALLRAVDAEEASRLTGLPLDEEALHLPDGAWLQPPALCRALLDHPNIEIRFNTEVATLQRYAPGWRALDSTSQLLAEAEVVVIANGWQANQLNQSAELPLQRLRGQVSHLPVNDDRPMAALCYEGYATPPFDGVSCIGASYDTDNDDLTPTQVDHRANLAMLTRWAPSLTDGVDPSGLTGRAAFRAATPDRLPLAGALPDTAFYPSAYAALHHGRRPGNYPPAKYHSGLYISAGHGSRGLVTCPLIGELIAAQLHGDPPPLERALIHALHPARFLIRELRRPPEHGVKSAV